MTTLLPSTSRYARPTLASRGPAMPVSGPAPTVSAVVLHARTVHSPAREAYAAQVREHELGPYAIVFHTCHRVELYVAGGIADRPELPAPPQGAVHLVDVEAVRHLIAVACGLDSMVLGEDQVLHQLRECLAERHQREALDPVLDRLFQGALRAGRRAHAWSRGPRRSLADVALDRIEEASGPLQGKAILVAGAGQMGRLAVLTAHRRGAQVLVTNRTRASADSLAREVGGEVIPFGSLGRGPLAGVIVALSGPWALAPDASACLADAAPPTVDLSSPTAVSDAIRQRLGRRFVSVDEVGDVCEAEPDQRLRHRLEGLVSECGREFCLWLRSRGSVPVLQAITESAEGVRRRELDWLLARLPELSEEDRGVLEQMSHRLVAALLHAPLASLREDGTGERERAARQLFGL